MSFYTYGEHGIIGEFFIDMEMINAAKMHEDGTLGIRYFKTDIEIVPLFRAKTP